MSRKRAGKGAFPGDSDGSGRKPISSLTRDGTPFIIQSVPVQGAESNGKGGIKVSEVRVKEGESLDSALRRFKRQVARSGVLAEVRKREAYEKPSVKRKKKSEAARKRKYK